MHRILLARVVDYCRARITEGDCDTIGQISAETLEEAIVALADGGTADSMFHMVRAFHRKMGQWAPAEPAIPSNRVLARRVNMLNEELTEYIEAVNAGDMVALADAIADIVYVAIGAAVEHGLLRFSEIFAEVHRSNMTKQPGAPGGKAIKGPEYSPPALRNLCLAWQKKVT